MMRIVNQPSGSPLSDLNKPIWKQVKVSHLNWNNWRAFEGWSQSRPFTLQFSFPDAPALDCEITISTNTLSPGIYSFPSMEGTISTSRG